MSENNRYGTAMYKLIGNGQMLCQEPTLVKEVNTIVQNELYRYGTDGVNFIFTDISLGQKIKQKHEPYIHISEIPFYYSRQDDFGINETVIDYDCGRLMNYLTDKDKEGKHMVNIVIMNPPFDKTLHLKMFNIIKKSKATRIYCIHPCTQLTSVTKYKDGKCKEFEEYVSEGVASQTFLPFDSFLNTKAYGDIVIDEYDNEDKSRNKPIKPNPWALRKDCKDKELYSIIYDRLTDKLQTTKSIKQALIPFGRNTDKLGYDYFLNISPFKCASRVGANNQLISDCHKEPYDKDGYTQNTSNFIPNKKHISENYWGGKVVKGMVCWNKGEYEVLPFNTMDDALSFYNTWSTPIAKLIVNCVTHDQNIKHELIPYYNGDLLSWLGLDTLKQEIQDEADWLDDYRKQRQENGK